MEEGHNSRMRRKAKRGEFRDQQNATTDRIVAKAMAAEKEKDPYAKRGYGGKDVDYDYDKYGATDDMYGTRRPWEK